MLILVSQSIAYSNFSTPNKPSFGLFLFNSPPKNSLIQMSESYYRETHSFNILTKIRPLYNYVAYILRMYYVSSSLVR